MAYSNCLPIPVGAQFAHPLHQMRSEGQLNPTPERTLSRLCSLGQLSPPPDWPLPPIPLRSRLRPASKTYGPPTPSNSGSSSSSHYSQDDELNSDGRSNRNTMLIQDHFDQRKIEFTLQRNSKQTPNLEDLSQLMHLRGRLQEMGTAFTAEGEMCTYGNPPLNSELEQMLRLGVMYDEQWNTFFNNGKTDEADNDLWSDLKVLKTMLQKEGINFDEQHRRRNYGTSHPKLIRLSDQYDVLYEEWLNKKIYNVHPTQRHELQRSPMQMYAPKTPTNLGWKFLLDDDGDDEDELVRKRSRRASRLTIVVEEQANAENGPGPTLEEGDAAYWSPPATPESLASVRDFDKNPSPARELTVGAPTLLHGPSHLQAGTTASMLQRDAESETRTTSTVSDVNGLSQYVAVSRYENAGMLAILVDDERRCAEERERSNRSAAGEEIHEEEVRRVKKSKGWRKWLRTVVGRKKDGGN